MVKVLLLLGFAQLDGACVQAVYEEPATCSCVLFSETVSCSTTVTIIVTS